MSKVSKDPCELSTKESSKCALNMYSIKRNQTLKIKPVIQDVFVESYSLSRIFECAD